MGPAKGTAGSHLLVAPEKLVSPKSTHTNKYQYARQSLTKAEPLKETVQNVICNILLRRNMNYIIEGNRNFKRQISFLITTINVQAEWYVKVAT